MRRAPLLHVPSRAPAACLPRISIIPTTPARWRRESSLCLTAVKPPTDADRACNDRAAVVPLFATMPRCGAPVATRGGTDEKVPLYSRSGRPQRRGQRHRARRGLPVPPPARLARRDAAPLSGSSAPRAAMCAGAAERGDCAALQLGGDRCAGFAGARWGWGEAPARAPTQKDIDAAVPHTLETKTLPLARRARLRGGTALGGAGAASARATTLQGRRRHRAQHRQRRRDRRQRHHPDQHASSSPGRRRSACASPTGTESVATVILIQPEHDLAVLQARPCPTTCRRRRALDRRPRTRRRG